MLTQSTDRSTLCRCLVVVVILALGLSTVSSAQTTRPDDAAIRDYLSANGLLNRGMNELAVKEYRSFLAANPNHEKSSLARYGLGVALFRLRQYAEAATELKKLNVPAGFQFVAEAQVILGQSLLELKNYKEATAAFKQVVDQHADHELGDDASALLIETLHRDGQFKAVPSQLDAMVARWPQSPQRERAEFFGALALVALNDHAGAAKLLTGMLERFPNGVLADRAGLLLAQSLHRANQLDQAAVQYEAVIKKGNVDNLPDAMLGLASLRLQQAKASEATALLDDLLKKFPQHRLAGAALQQRGRAYFETGQYDQAFNSFQGAAKLDALKPDESAYWMAKCELRRGDHAAAASRLAEAIKANPQSPLLAEMTYDRGVAITRVGDLPHAAEVLRSFQANFANHALAPDALHLLASIENQQQHYDESVRLCKQFKKAYPSHSLATSIDFLAADNEFLQNRDVQAAEAYRAFLATHPKDDRADIAQMRLGTSLFHLGKFDEAKPALSAVVDGPRTKEPMRRALLMLGQIAFQGDDWSTAAGRFKDFLLFGLEQPAADDALLKLGLAQIRMNQPDDAKASFTRLAEQFPKSPHRIQAMFESGQILLEQKQLDAAGTALNRVVTEGKDSRFAPYALNHLAAIAMQRQEFGRRAAELFEQAAQSGAGTELEPEAVFQQGQSLMAAKQYEQADKAFSRFIDSFAAHARQPQARLQRVIALARRNEPEQALAAIDAIDPATAAKLPPADQALLLYEKAWCLRGVNRMDDAIKAYRSLLESHERQPLAAHAMLELAEMESTAGHQEQAVELLDRLRSLQKDGSLAVRPDIAESALYRLGVAKFNLGQFEPAAGLFDELITTYPQSQLLASAHMFAGESLYKLDKHGDAATHLRQVVESFPSDPACGPSLLRLGECQAALGDWPASQKSFQTHLERFPDSDVWFQAQFGLAWAMENQSQPDQAIEQYHKVIERHNGPTAARAQFQIGECLYAKKQYDDAVRELLKVDILYGYPQWSAAALFEAGRCFEELAKPAEARAQYEQVQQKYPQTRWAKLAAERLTTTKAANAATGG